ncbi:MAG: hypothetical protein A2653_02490 [Candidatus Zambryskibacteria bacterium RIFCSPHIGHO2_01_FULL_43_25]|uniref:SMC-Scp complex subunit ScpB n=1 Tax=Candidatus Zambryskibacteria bacterium RIFCSPLOWO2_01_FULL_45_21 TaxID=1802761 RepID=A0A1G2U359_9BACT|nr:MAG: hypothetical protein A2653_02490 [Candidatus Zambryskibacteria bacterium RIFCSPHIGHO2_01_FULL_43_25]OHB01066.1 MAG: hypothetical protein A3E94_02670 [Candidatus Zambryskibacteria bacterium RIFCSPHIGHO2_12_FULL_44_12b]OHB03889.1 MAG: hypothetical protein A3B14_00960 [Candidatus Zambryskibacteria bacterium RIFCSPLOWO2_01_FULL_45_21]
MELKTKIEAILFYKAEPISFREIAKMLAVTREEVAEAVFLLQDEIANRGVILIQNGEEASLGTSKDASALIEDIRREELTRDLGKAGLETLAVILYKGEASRREIEYIRGVNSNFTVRSLLIRGLIERDESSKGGRGFLYKPTTETLSLLGIQKLKDLPEYESVLKEFENFSKKEESDAKENGGEQPNTAKDFQ